MSKFPYIKWSQNNDEIIIEILHHGKNYSVNKNNNFLQYNDHIYDINLDLLNDFEIKDIKDNKHLKIILNKTDNTKWIKLLKNEKQYKYYISTDWDKYLEDELEEENNDSNMFNPDMYNSDMFQNMLSNQQLNNINENDDDNNEIENEN